MILLAPHCSESLAPSNGGLFSSSKRATSPLQNRVGGLRRRSSGRLSRSRSTRPETATGSTAFSCKTASGRSFFLSRDPIGMVAGTNLYEYVWDNPVNLKDPDGLQAVQAAQAARAMAVPIAAQIALWMMLLRKAQIANCENLYNQYKSDESNCRRCSDKKCKTDEEKAQDAINCACWKKALAGRWAYLANKCDYVLPGSIAAGSRQQEAAHWQEYANKQNAADNCCK